MNDKNFSLLINELEDPSRREKAIFDLIRLQDSRSEAYFIKIVLDDSVPILDRSWAMGGLWNSSSQEAVVAIRKILETSESRDLVITAIEVLGLLKDTQSGISIIKYLSTSYDEGLRYMAAQSLGRIRYMPALPYLQKMLKEDSAVIRQYACGALIDIIQTLDSDDKEYVNILSDLRGLHNDPSEIISSRVQAFLAYIGNEHK